MPVDRDGVPKPRPASLATVKVAAGRLSDALTAPYVAPLRAVCFLQTWQAPLLNLSLIALLCLVCLIESNWAAAARFWPLALGAVTPLLGYISFLIHKGDPAPFYDDEVAEENRAEREEEAEKARKAPIHSH